MNSFIPPDCWIYPRQENKMSRGNEEKVKQFKTFNKLQTNLNLIWGLLSQRLFPLIPCVEGEASSLPLPEDRGLSLHQRWEPISFCFASGKCICTRRLEHNKGYPKSWSIIYMKKSVEFGCSLIFLLKGTTKQAKALKSFSKWMLQQVPTCKTTTTVIVCYKAVCSCGLFCGKVAKTH